MFILCFLVCWVLLVWYIKPFVRVGFAKCISVGLCLVLLVCIVVLTCGLLLMEIWLVLFRVLLYVSGVCLLTCFVWLLLLLGLGFTWYLGWNLICLWLVVWLFLRLVDFYVVCGVCLFGISFVLVALLTCWWVCLWVWFWYFSCCFDGIGLFC